MKKRAWASILVIGALSSFVPPAFATLLPPGTSPTSPDIFGVSPGGTLLASTGITPYSTTFFSGTYQASVFSDPLNPVCAGCLDFVYMFTNDETSTDSIKRATAAVFNGFTTDVGYDNTSPGIAPATVDRSMNGNVVGFNFPVPEGVFPGNQSRVLVVYTNATAYAPGFFALINGSTANLQGFQPVPEPGTLLLVGSGLAGLAGRRFARRRRRA